MKCAGTRECETEAHTVRVRLVHIYIASDRALCPHLSSDTQDPTTHLSKSLVDELAGIGDGHGGRLARCQQSQRPHCGGRSSQGVLEGCICIAEADMLAISILLHILLSDLCDGTK
jgi:hypothetical protein